MIGVERGLAASAVFPPAERFVSAVGRSRIDSQRVRSAGAAACALRVSSAVRSRSDTESSAFAPLVDASRPEAFRSLERDFESITFELQLHGYKGNLTPAIGEAPALSNPSPIRSSLLQGYLRRPSR